MAFVFFSRAPQENHAYLQRFQLIPLQHWCNSRSHPEPRGRESIETTARVDLLIEAALYQLDFTGFAPVRGLARYV